MARKKKEKAPDKCYKCRNPITGEPAYKAGYTGRVFCSIDCKNIYFNFATEINKTEPMLKKIIYLFSILCTVESTNNPGAINGEEQAYGIVQIRQAALDDVNRVYKTKYKLTDCLNIEKSRDVFKKYLTIWGNHYEGKTNCEATIEVLARMWNGGGPSGYKKESTKKYWLKVEEIISKDCKPIL